MIMREVEEKPKRAVVVAVQLSNVSDSEFEASIAELRQLAKTLGHVVVGTLTQKRGSFDSAAYLGVGKRNELRRWIRNEPEETDAPLPTDDPESLQGTQEGAAAQDATGAAPVSFEGVAGTEPAAHTHADAHSQRLGGDGQDGEEEPERDDNAAADAGSATHGRAAREATRRARAADREAKAALTAAKEAEDEPAPEDTRRADIILVDHEISPSQARNLEKAAGCPVYDRTMVILDIFHRHANSRAARAQVEIVRLSYMSPRLREAAKLRASGGRQRSGVGGRGAGESQGELDRRKIRDRIAELQGELEAMDVERKTQRARRQERTGLARVALVGYTNAGKSTLMRALTGSEVLVADKLFATLDTTVRALHPESMPRVLVSDTVGFIKNLPHGLVASFKSTLDEALEASLLAHVIDASDPGFERQLAVTDAVLAEIGAGEVPRILLFNKIDRVGDAPAQEAQEAALRAKYPGCVVLSAKRADDINLLYDRIVAHFRSRLVESDLLVGWAMQHLRGEIFARCQVLEEGAEERGAIFKVRGDPADIEALRLKLGGGSVAADKP